MRVEVLELRVEEQREVEVDEVLLGVSGGGRGNADGVDVKRAQVEGDERGVGVVLVREHAVRQRDMEPLQLALEEVAVVLLREGARGDAHGGLTEIAVIDGECDESLYLRGESSNNTTGMLKGTGIGWFIAMRMRIATTSNTAEVRSRSLRVILHRQKPLLTHQQVGVGNLLRIAVFGAPGLLIPRFEVSAVAAPASRGFVTRVAVVLCVKGRISTHLVILHIEAVSAHAARFSVTALLAAEGIVLIGENAVTARV